MPKRQSYLERLSGRRAAARRRLPRQRANGLATSDRSATSVMTEPSEPLQEASHSARSEAEEDLPDLNPEPIEIECSVDVDWWLE